MDEKTNRIGVRLKLVVNREGIALQLWRKWWLVGNIILWFRPRLRLHPYWKGGLFR